MFPKILIGLLPLILGAQIQISYSPRSEELYALSGKKLKNGVVLSVEVCNLDDKTVMISSGRVYQEINKKGITTISPEEVPLLIKRAQQKSKVNRILGALNLGSGGAAILTVTDIIKANKEWSAGLFIASATFNLLSNYFQGERIDVTGLLTRLLKGDILLGSQGNIGACSGFLALGLGKNIKPDTMTFTPYTVYDPETGELKVLRRR